jgi:hypothetical protein
MSAMMGRQLPGFTAELSLYKTGRSYGGHVNAPQISNGIHPQWMVGSYTFCTADSCDCCICGESDRHMMSYCECMPC